MLTREITANASHLIIEQLVASGVKYVFNNSGSREALFFNELHSRPDIHGILEVWPESHWPGFALREADVFKTYMAWWCM